MRFELISEEEFTLFINNCYKKINDYNDKNEIIKFVKEIFLKYKKKFKMMGFYKVKVYLEEKVGIFLDVVKLDAFDSDSSLDLRVIVYYDEDIYFKTDNYFIIKDILNIKFYDGNYYCLVKDIYDINFVIEYGEFVYGDNISSMLDKIYSI